MSTRLRSLVEHGRRYPLPSLRWLRARMYPRIKWHFLEHRSRQPSLRHQWLVRVTSGLEPRCDLDLGPWFNPHWRITGWHGFSSSSFCPPLSPAPRPNWCRKFVVDDTSLQFCRACPGPSVKPLVPSTVLDFGILWQSTSPRAKDVQANSHPHLRISSRFL